MSTPETDPTDAAMRRLMTLGDAGDALDLSIGGPDQPLPADLVEVAVGSLREGRTGYTPKAGLAELRAAIADDATASLGVPVEAAAVTVTIGGTGAVATALAAAVKSGESIAVPDPAWPNYRVLAAQLGIRVESWEQGPTGAFFDRAGLERALDAGARAIVVNSPCNPTGAVATTEELALVAELARRHDAWIISDEAYESVVVAGGRAPSIASLAPERTLVARTFSKTFSMPGLRVGSLVTPPPLRTAVAAVHGTTAGCAPITGQLVALEALRAHAGRGDELATAYGARFRRAAGLLADRLPGDVEGLGGFYLWLDVGPGRTGTGVAAELEDRGILVSPGAAFSARDDRIRVALTAPDDELDAALATIAEVLAQR